MSTQSPGKYARFEDLEEKIETLSPRDHVVDTLTAKQIISCRGKNENDCEMYKNRKKLLQICDVLVVVVIMVS